MSSTSNLTSNKNNNQKIINNMESSKSSSAGGVAGVAIAEHSKLTYKQIKTAGPPTRPLDFPPPKVRAGVRVNALVVHPESGTRQVCSGVIHREDVTDHLLVPTNNPTNTTNTNNTTTSSSHHHQVLAYWPQRRLQDAIYGSVWACLVLRRHYGIAADDAARAAGVEPGSPSAPIVWEITGSHVAIKMVEWARVHHMRGRLLEDPVKEVAALQMLGGHENVLGSSEVLQDGDFLYSVMPYCRDGDLFGIVVKYAEECGGEIGMPEPVARYWFRQILWVSPMLSSKRWVKFDASRTWKHPSTLISILIYIILFLFFSSAIFHFDAT
jgi:hypothetical protein